MTQTFDERIGDLVEIRREIARLRQIESDLIDEIHDAAPGRKTETEHGLVEVSKRRNRRWDHDELTRQRARRGRSASCRLRAYIEIWAGAWCLGRAE